MYNSSISFDGPVAAAALQVAHQIVESVSPVNISGSNPLDNQQVQELMEARVKTVVCLAHTLIKAFVEEVGPGFSERMLEVQKDSAKPPR